MTAQRPFEFWVDGLQMVCRIQFACLAATGTPLPGNARREELVAARAAQRKGFKRSQLTLSPHHIVVGDLDRGETAAL